MIERALEVASDMASMPADSYRHVKLQVRRLALARIGKVLGPEGDPLLDGWLSPEAQAAATTLLDKPCEHP